MQGDLTQWLLPSPPHSSEGDASSTSSIADSPSRKVKVKRASATPAAKRIGKPPRPGRKEGGWKGGAGFRALQTLLTETRFRLPSDLATPELWNFYWACLSKRARLVSEPDDDHAPQLPNRMPLVCTICNETTSASTLNNFLNNYGSARCACNGRRIHSTAEAREELVQLYAPIGWEPVVSAEEWVEHHRERSGAWHAVKMRCTAGCGAVKSIPATGILRVQRRTPCVCTQSLLTGSSVHLESDNASFLAVERLVSDAGMVLEAPATSEAWTLAATVQGSAVRTRLTVACGGCGRTTTASLQSLRAQWRANAPSCGCAHARQSLAQGLCIEEAPWGPLED